MELLLALGMMDSTKRGWVAFGEVPWIQLQNQKQNSKVLIIKKARQWSDLNLIKTITWKDSYNIHAFFEVFPLLCPKGKWKMFFRWKTFLHGPSSLGKLVFLSPCCPQTLLNLLHPSQFQQKEYRVECCKNTKYKNTKYFVDCREKQNWKIKNTWGLRKFKMCNILEENTFTCMYSNNRVGEEVHLTVKWNWSASKVKSWGEGVDLEVKVTSPVHFNTIEIWGDSLFSKESIFHHLCRPRPRPRMCSQQIMLCLIWS